MKKPLSIYIAMLACVMAGCQAAADKHVSSDKIIHPQAPKATLSKEDSLRYHKAVQQYYNTHFASRSFNGGILVAKNGTIVFEHYQGLKDLRDKSDSLTAETPLHIASTSKTITGMAILRLVQEGRLQLSDSLTRFFPQVAYKGVTIEMLLSHRSGLPNYLYYFEQNGWDRNKMVTNKDVLESLYTTDAGWSARPGTHFTYCNTNFVLLALVIEKITGMTYPAYLQKEFFDPLGMQHTYVYTVAKAAMSVPSFQWTGQLWRLDQFDLTYGDKNIYSTPRDLLKWDQAISHGLVVDKSLLDSAYTPHSNESRSTHNYGLAWRMLNLPTGKKVIYHNGRWHGFNSMFARLTEDNATIIILGNRYNRNIYEARKMYDIFGNYYGHGTDDDDSEESNSLGSP